MPQLPTPALDDADAWVAAHLGHLTAEGPAVDPAPRSGAFTGGQTAADAALAAYDVRGYAGRRNQVWPPERRGASKLSPWIRHGLLQLRHVWDAVEGGPSRDVRKYRDELLWQEYARHVQARLGRGLAQPLRAEPVVDPDPAEDPWDPRMRCMEAMVGELHDDGWVVNQARMWLASQWSVREGATWQDGEDAMFTHLLDGSRAANRVGWQWTIGTGSGKRYGFSRWQVEKRAPQLCRECALSDDCPIQRWPTAGQDAPSIGDVDPRIRRDPDVGGSAGPRVAEQAGQPEAVWLTAESLGDDDPALAAHADLPVVFVFDEPLLDGLRLSGKRLVFLAECLADLAQRRDVRVHLGEVDRELAGTPVAVTHAPVPGFAARSARVDVAARHPWPWLAQPHGGSIRSFTAWRKGLDRTGPR